MDIAAVVSGERTCIVLVDYDNAFPPGLGLTDEEVAVDVAAWLRKLADRYPTIDRFEVRLYGGWYDYQDLSRHGSDAARAITFMPSFPLSMPNSAIVRGSISLAVNPLGMEDLTPLLGTYRVRNALPRIRLTKQPYPESCARIEPNCPASILRSFTKAGHRQCPVESCSLVSKEAFVVHEQKMVDTMLATDVLTASSESGGYSLVVVVSGDSDFVPPLLTAARGGKAPLVVIQPRPNEASSYATDLLRDAAVDVIEETDERV